MEVPKWTGTTLSGTRYKQMIKFNLGHGTAGDIVEAIDSFKMWCPTQHSNHWSEMTKQFRRDLIRSMQEKHYSETQTDQEKHMENMNVNALANVVATMFSGAVTEI